MPSQETKPASFFWCNFPFLLGQVLLFQVGVLLGCQVRKWLWRSMGHVLFGTERVLYKQFFGPLTCIRANPTCGLRLQWMKGISNFLYIVL